MENNDRGLTPLEAAAALRDAEVARGRLAAHVVVPRGAHLWLGAAVAVQIASAAIGFGVANRWTAPWVVGGVVIFAAVASVQIVRFRRLNGVALSGYTSRVVLGASTRSSLAYAAGFAASFAAAMAGRWWLVGLTAAIGGVAYAVSGGQWMASYRRDPAALARGENLVWWLTVGGLAVVGLVLLLVAA